MSINLAAAHVQFPAASQLPAVSQPISGVAAATPIVLPAPQIDKLATGKSGKSLSVIIAVFVAIVVSWLISFNTAAFAVQKPASRAAQLLCEGQTACRSGNYKAADRILTEAYEAYCSSGYPADELAQLCTARAQTKEHLGEIHEAQQLYDQAAAFAANQH